MRISDWSSDVCSSDLAAAVGLVGAEVQSANGDRAAGHAQHQIAIVAELRFFVGQFGAVNEHAFGPVQADASCTHGVRFGDVIAGLDRKGDVLGKSVSVRVVIGGRRSLKKKIENSTKQNSTKH